MRYAHERWNETAGSRRDYCTKNASEALSLARSIEDPWSRCQALAIASVHVRDVRSRKSAIDDAFFSASKLDGATVKASKSVAACKATEGRVASRSGTLIELDLVTLKRAVVDNRQKLGPTAMEVAASAGMIREEYR